MTEGERPNAVENQSPDVVVPLPELIIGRLVRAGMTPQRAAAQVAAGRLWADGVQVSPDATFLPAPAVRLVLR